MWPETYSQYDEQIAIGGYFEKYGLRDGRFLDIGAWDPKTFSNTRALYELGWAGVMIEPSPKPMLALLEEYGNDPRVTLVQAAIGLEDSLVTFKITDDSVSTSDLTAYNKWKDTAKFHGAMKVRTITWEQINLWWDPFQFVNIDVEGYSVDVFHAMLKAERRPLCCCVEFDDRGPELVQAATAVGYKVIHGNGTNMILGL